MAALEIMDLKMDCCEVPSKKESTENLDEKTTQRMVFPRPTPTGLDDEVDPLPWDELTMEDAVFIATENLVRLESFLTDGSSIVESTFTSLYAHKSVMENMKRALEPSSLTEQMQAIMTTSRKGTLSQNVVLLIELTELLREVIMNADIFEEEDFTVSTYNLEIFTDRDTATVVKVGLEMMKDETLQDEIKNTTSEVIKSIELVLKFQLDFISIITTLARLSGTFVREELTKSQATARAAVTKAALISTLIKELKKSQSESTRIVLKRTFDSNVNRPLVGNAPLRKIVFKEAEESIPILQNIVGQLDRVVCIILLKANTLGRIRYMMRDASTCSANILTRSLLVLNLYFDDKIFGQYLLPELIVNNLKQLSGIPDSAVTSTTGAEAFLNRLCKPIYDTLKVLALNQNRQRSYIDVMLGDWSALREEAYIVDMTYHQDVRPNQELQPYFSLYVLCITIELMDNFVSLGVKLKLTCDEEGLGVAFWYRDFLTSSLVSQMSTMRQGRNAARELQFAEQLKKQSSESQHQSAKKTNKGGKKKGKGKKANSNQNNNVPPAQPTPTPEDFEDDFDFMLCNAKRTMSRGLVRFFAALRQAGIVTEKQYEFTTYKRIFEKRFEVFVGIQQPPPLTYEDYVKGSDFSKVTQKDLLASTADAFRLGKSMIDRLLVQVPLMDPDYLPAKKEELQQLNKVCLGNSIYLQKLMQIIHRKEESKARVTIDT
eukprot:CAMPEP_0116154340 /NCGR_PEP_ID=MMETSP0329-20121206/21729_1 /TAXON_ID=697910 /ORGANISM="Pseudo-nitzschia arenysensis, Strain B593" /LENGTH=716 /DNA_ID=CAMNT_0003651315 /DNA_START=206 /DNA_END=2353 /DNA_ORIENTATION=+